MHRDERGIFVETYRREWFPNGREMIQGNRGDRQAGAVVGLHYHLHQADYWYVADGRVRVVLHDLREGSPTDGATLTLDLGQAADGTYDHRGVFIPPGVAHGFASLTDMTITYLVDCYYNPADELGVAWDDPEVGRRLGHHRPDPLEARPDEPAAARRSSRSGARTWACEHRAAVNILVTGGAGFIGSNFTRYWVEHHPGDHAVVLDLLTYAGNRPNLDDVEDRITFVQGDIADFELVEQVLRERTDRRHRELRRRVAQQPGRARPRAASSAPTSSARRRCSKRLAASGSTASITSRRARCTATSRSTARSCSRRSRRTGPGRRTTRRRRAPTTPVRAYHETYGLPVTITNCANNYGPYQFPEKVIPVFVTSALDDTPLQMYASTENRREWIHALDHCAAIDAVLERGRVGETYHVGTGVEKSIEEIADAVLAELGKPADLKTIIPDRPGHDRRYILDWTKIRRELGWEPRDPVRSGPRGDGAAGMRRHRDWWEPLRERAPVVEGAAWK